MSEQLATVDSTVIYLNCTLAKDDFPRIALTSSVLVNHLYLSSSRIKSLAGSFEVVIKGVSAIRKFATDLVGYYLYVKNTYAKTSTEDVKDTFIFKTLVPWLRNIIENNSVEKVLYVTIPLLNQTINVDKTSISINKNDTFLATYRFYGNILLGELISASNSTPPLFTIATYASEYNLCTNDSIGSPCSVCPECGKKIGSYCMLFEQGYSCLFSKNIAITRSTLNDTTKLAAALSSRFDSEDIDALDNVDDSSVTTQCILGIKVNKDEREDIYGYNDDESWEVIK